MKYDETNKGKIFLSLCGCVCLFVLCVPINSPPLSPIFSLGDLYTLVRLVGMLVGAIGIPISLATYVLAD